jgi:hypothetical protein
VEHRHHVVPGLLSGRGLWISLALALAFAGASLALSSCGTGAAPAGGDQHLPNARVGPFRVLRTGETSRRAPFIFESGLWRDPEIVPIGDVPGARARLFVAGGGATNGFLAFTDLEQAVDRGNAVPTRVLEPSESWEGGSLGAPSVLVEGGRTVLFYAAGGCIGRAVAEDGESFVRDPLTPVFCGDERGPVASPSVVRGADGVLRLFHEQAGVLAEARADDPEGRSFLPGEVILAPSAEAAGFDAGGVADPYALPLTDAAASVTGRTIRYLYYTATSGEGARTIALAARFGDDGPFERAREPVLTRYQPRAPTALVLPTVTLLYASSVRDEVGSEDPAILGGLAPATIDRPLPVPAPADSGASP